MDPEEEQPHFFPSVPAAMVAGAVFVPILIIGMKALQARGYSDVVLMLWAVLTFFVPVFLSCTDFRYQRRHYKNRSFLIPMIAPRDFEEYYFPAWFRMFVWFVSAGVSCFLLKAFGVPL